MPNRIVCTKEIPCHLHQRKLHMCNWDTLCQSIPEARLGIRNMELLSKQDWRLLTCPRNLAEQVLSGKYCRTQHFWRGDWVGIEANSCLLFSDNQVGNQGISTNKFIHPTLKTIRQELGEGWVTELVKWSFSLYQGRGTSFQ